MVCPLCGYGTNPPGARFCAGCGRLLDEAVRAAQRQPAAAAAGGTQPASPWSHGGIAGLDAGRGASDRPAAPEGVAAQTADPGHQAAGNQPPSGSAATGRPEPQRPAANGRPVSGDAPDTQARPSSSRPPMDEPRRTRPQAGNSGSDNGWSGSPPSEPFALPAGVAALAASSRTWAAAAPLSALIAGFMSGVPALFGALGADVGARAGLGGLPAILGPLLIWQMRQKDDRFAAQHGLNALNFNLTVLTLAFGLTLFTTLTWGIGALIAAPVGIVLVVGWLLCSAIATSRAWKGQSYRYPLAFRFARSQ